MLNEQEAKAKAIDLINAYFDPTKTILVKDPIAGISEWENINSPTFWTFLGEFINHLESYKIIDR